VVSPNDPKTSLSTPHASNNDQTQPTHNDQESSQQPQTSVEQ
jgi:hypothetical protein